MHCTLELLNKFVLEYNAVLSDDLPDIKNSARIPFTCRCGIKDIKTFDRIRISGVLCKKCTTIQKQEKAKITNIEKYGTEYTFQSNVVKDKIKKSCLEKYGGEHAMCSDIVKDKIKQTNLERYGVENPYASPEIIEKIRNTCLKKYGTEYPMKTDAVREKVVKTNMEKYGVPVSSKAESVKLKAIQTNMEKYGNYHHCTPEVMQKIKETNMKRYGVEHAFQSEVVKNKIKATSVLRYGVSHPMYSSSIKQKIINTMMHRYGVKYPMNLKSCLDKRVVTYLRKYGVRNPLQSKEVQQKHQKNSYKYKKYVTGNGVIRKYQGFEHFALDILLKERGLAEKDVISDREFIPTINYTINNANKYYFPDIYVIPENKIIEVKSLWIYNLHKEVNIKKWEATVNNGYDCEFWIFDHKRNLTVIKDPR